MFYVTFVYYAARKPYSPETTIMQSVNATTTSRQDILDLLRLHGRGSLSYSALQEGMLWYVKPGIGLIQYEQLEPISHSPIVLGDPICQPEHADELLSDFMIAHPDPAFIHISAETGTVLEKHGFYVNEMGVETLIEIQTFTLSGSKKEFLRSQKNRAGKDGVVVRELQEANISSDKLRHISEEWMHRKANHDHELSFLVRPAVFENEPDVRKFVAMQHEEVIGFVFFDPMYRDGKPYGYMANILRTLGERSYSITDFIILEAMEKFKREGVETLSLGFVPFYGVDDKGEFHYSKPLHDMFKYTYEHANHLYSFKSLAFHKERYRPDQPGACDVKVYAGTKHVLPMFTLYGVFRKMGIHPVTQTLEQAVECTEQMINSVPEELHHLIQHWRACPEPAANS